MNTSHGAVAVEVKSAPSWPSRAHDLSPLLRTVRSHKDRDVDISFSGSKASSLADSLAKLKK